MAAGHQDARSVAVFVGFLFDKIVVAWRSGRFRQFEDEHLRIIFPIHWPPGFHAPNDRPPAERVINLFRFSGFQIKRPAMTLSRAHTHDNKRHSIKHVITGRKIGNGKLTIGISGGAEHQMIIMQIMPTDGRFDIDALLANRLSTSAEGALNASPRLQAHFGLPAQFLYG